MIIAVDFDGTVVEHQYPKIGPLKPGAKEALQAFRKAGHKIAIWTCRAGKEEKEVRDFLQSNGIPFDTVNAPIMGADLGTRKIYADLYIDDKGLRFEDNWDEMRRVITGK
jgi:hydroxymethylpyrimidine pyrophosphatase-like HAD family hydrolase